MAEDGTSERQRRAGVTSGTAPYDLDNRRMSSSADSPPTRLILATRNAHKVTELRAILADSGLDSLELTGADAFPDIPDVKETGTTFAENALLKARTLAHATGIPAIADDSGLCVDILGGAPGIFSARWAGRHGDDTANLDLLLAQLCDIEPAHRAAHFACAAALALPDGTERVAEGHLNGILRHTPSGTGGFGYDPILQPDGETRTCAELTPQEKNAISHRGRAFRALAPAVRELLG
jgi:XTP/dITP diphosphohydrolase